MVLPLVGLMVVAAMFIHIPSVQAAPFVCEPGFYQVMTGTFKKLNPETGSYTTIGSTALYLNAVGYNVEDDYIYGLNNDPGGSTLMRIEDDGSYTNLGAVTNLPSSGSALGDLDHSGNLYVQTDATTLYQIDVSAVSATAINLSASVTGINDMVYINGHLYGTNGTTLYDITIADGTVVNKPLNIAAAVYGAGWASADDRLYFSQNQSGVIYEVTDYATPSPTASAVLQGDGNLVGNDGASCSQAQTVIIAIDAQNDTATTAANQVLTVTAQNGLLQNDSPESVTVTDYSQPSHGSVSVQPDGSYIYTPNADFVGEDTFTYTITDTVGNTATAMVTIIITAADPIDVPGPPDSGGRNTQASGPLLAFATGTLFFAGMRIKRRFWQ